MPKGKKREAPASARTGSVDMPLPPPASPPEFSEIWTHELEIAWQGMNERQRAFLKAWYLNGFHGTKAYQEAYLITDKDVAGVNASRLLADARIYLFRQAIQNALKPPIEQINQVLTNALSAEKPIFSDGDHIMDVEDHPTRMVAAEKLLKMHNLEKPVKVDVKHTGEITHTVNLGPLKDILNGPTT